MLESVSVDEFGQSHFQTFTVGSFETNLSGHEQGTNFNCVELRTRALNGTYGGMERMPMHEISAPTP